MMIPYSHMSCQSRGDFFLALPIMNDCVVFRVSNCKPYFYLTVLPEVSTKVQYDTQPQRRRTYAGLWEVVMRSNFEMNPV